MAKKKNSELDKLNEDLSVKQEQLEKLLSEGDDKAAEDLKVEIEIINEQIFELLNPTIKMPEAKNREGLKAIEAKITDKTDELIVLLSEAEKYATEINRPHRHYFIYKQRFQVFGAQFKKMQR